LFLKEKKCFCYACYLLGCPLAMYLSYHARAGITGYCCGGLVIVSAGGQGYLLSGIWVSF